MLENEGWDFDDEQQPMKFGSAEVVPDREVGQANNVYLVRGGGQAASIPRLGFHDLLQAAAQGVTDFNAIAPNVLPFWGGLTAQERTEQYKLYSLDSGVSIWLQVERLNDNYLDTGPAITDAQRVGLIQAAAVSRASFDSLMGQVAGSWFAGLNSANRDHYYYLYRDM